MRRGSPRPAKLPATSKNKQRLLGGTRDWNKTWYDSTLPYWLLDRSFIPIDCVASQMFHWFDNGRPYAWEGVDCCPGTCTHVWHYAQALGRVFPELERAFREMGDQDVTILDPEGLVTAAAGLPIAGDTSELAGFAAAIAAAQSLEQ